MQPLLAATPEIARGRDHAQHRPQLQRQSGHDIEASMTSPAPTAKVADTIRKAECSKCGGMRNCDILGKHSEGIGDENYQEYTTWYILKCRGCENVFIQTVSTNSEDYENSYEEDGSTGTTHNETIKYWPALSKRKKPEWMLDYGIDVENVGALDAAMVELYGALENDLRMLAATGIRTTYDIASELLGIDPSLTFAEKLDALVSSGGIGILDKDRLETMVDVGSASAHRGWRPPPSDLNTMMDVLEHFIQESFVVPAHKRKLDAEAAKVKKTVPPKPPRAKKK
jgi:hypothetical protein